jgi:hypothetical protein
MLFEFEFGIILSFIFQSRIINRKINRTYRVYKLGYFNVVELPIFSQNFLLSPIDKHFIKVL